MFGSPLALFALLSLPAVVLLHYLRRRTRRIEVASLVLWERLLERKELPPARAFEVDLSLFLQLAACLALALALSRPRARVEARAGLAVVIDNSTSMETLSRSGDTRLEEAIRVAEALRPAAVVATSPHSHRVERLDELAGVHLPGDVDGAVSLALRLADGVYVVGDALPEGVAGKRVGDASRNCAVVACEFAEGGAFAAVRSFSEAEEEREVVLSAGGRRVASERVRLAPGERRALVLKGELSGERLVELRLAPADELPADDVVRGVARPEAGVAVFFGPREEAIERAVRACGWELARAEDPQDAPEGGACFCVACGPEIPQAQFVAYFGAGPPGRVEASGGEMRRVTGVAFKDVPCLKGIDGGRLLVRSAVGASPVGPAKVLARAEGNPLIWRWSEGGKERMFFAFLPSDSDWPKKPSWPVFIARLLEAAGGKGWGWLRPGERGPPDLAGGSPVLRCGLYDSAAGKVAVNLLDGKESDNRLGAAGASAEPPGGARKELGLSWVFASLALGFILADWFARR